MPHFLDNIKATLRDGMKASGGMFSGGGGTSSGINNVGYMGANWSSNPFRLSAGSRIDWSAVTGGIQENPIASTCLSIISENYVQARIRVEKRAEGEDKYEADASHPLLPLFKHPNDFYSWDYLQKGVIASLHGTGDAYIGIERDSRGRPSELYWLPYGVTPRKEPGSRKLWDGWNYTVGRDTKQIPTEDIIHIPFGSNPARPGFGLSGWQALKQDVYTLQQAANYTANVMRNNGTSGAILSPKTIKDSNDNIVQVDIDDKALVDKYRSKTRGDNAGDVIFLDFPFDITFPKNTPEDLALGEMLARPECNICAVFRVSILLVGAKGGDGAKTYANYGEARSSLWEECLLPLQSIVAAELTTQLLPQMGGDPVTQRVAYDTGSIRALQPDMNALHETYRADFMANLISRADFKRATKQQVIPEDEGVYAWQMPKVTDTAQTDGGFVTQGLENAGHDVPLLQDKQDANQQARENATLMPVQPNARLLAAAGGNGNGKPPLGIGK